jgi:hypothetical protein
VAEPALRSRFDGATDDISSLSATRNRGVELFVKGLSRYWKSVVGA